MPVTRLKHVYSAITVTTNDLRSIAAHARTLGPTTIRANAYVLGDMDEIHQVLAEDVVVDHLSIFTEDRDGGSLTFTFQTGYVLLEISDPLPDLLTAFEAVGGLLVVKAANGLNQCVIEVSPAGTWREPKPWARMPKQARPQAPTVALVGPRPQTASASPQATSASPQATSARPEARPGTGARPEAGPSAISGRTRAARGWLQRLRDRFGRDDRG